MTASSAPSAATTSNASSAPLAALGVRGFLVEVADDLLALPNRIVLDHFGAFDPRLGLEQPAFTTILRMLDTGGVRLKDGVRPERGLRAGRRG